MFRDLTTVFTDATSFCAVVDHMIGPFAGQFDAVAGLDARGFLLAGATAVIAGVGVLPIRKAGKLPGKVLTESYELEYGHAAFETRADVLPLGTRVLVMDDVLATGGTLGAAISLIERAGWVIGGSSVAVEIADLDGRTRLVGYPCHSVVTL